MRLNLAYPVAAICLLFRHMAKASLILPPATTDYNGSFPLIIPSNFFTLVPGSTPQYFYKEQLAKIGDGLVVAGQTSG